MDHGVRGPVTTAPPRPADVQVAAPSRRDRLRGPLVTVVVVGALAVALHLRDPHQEGSWGLCPWFVLTGHYCPGCGTLRAVNDLSNGDIVSASSSNLLFVVLVPVLVVWWLAWARRSWTGRTGERGVRHPGAWIAAATVVMLAFGILRNLSVGSWLAP